ncbi:MAG TPA: plastocyanin/azurin family copper-binding protein [Candidatus Limnocylindria bacterium]|nr:plastocyanin/azurin family copper-binding protein [Candidatus Limnocylindria bacterium]
MATCAGSASPAAEPVATDHVNLPQSYLFDPKDIVVAPGTTVTWKNSDQFTHSVHIIDGDRMVGTMKPGESVSFTFATAGTYRYECTFHPQNMRGTVTVR